MPEPSYAPGDKVKKARADPELPIVVEVRDNDPPNPQIGRIWLRRDL